MPKADAETVFKNCKRCRRDNPPRTCNGLCVQWFAMQPGTYVRWSWQSRPPPKQNHAVISRWRMCPSNSLPSARQCAAADAAQEVPTHEKTGREDGHGQVSTRAPSGQGRFLHDGRWDRDHAYLSRGTGTSPVCGLSPIAFFGRGERPARVLSDIRHGFPALRSGIDSQDAYLAS